MAAGITGFKLHSTHSASASGALKVGVPVGDVLIRGGWANPHNFFKYYARTVQVDYSAAAVFKDFFKTQDGKGVRHYAPTDPVPVAPFRGIGELQIRTTRTCSQGCRKMIRYHCSIGSV